jgi:flavorubredoxin
VKVSDDIAFVGVNDHRIDLFEGQYDVREIGMSYNSYVILDQKVAVMDSVDAAFRDEWFANLDQVLGDRKPDYLVVHHMEPDHSANIAAFMDRYPEAQVVSSAQSFKMMQAYFGVDYSDRGVVVKQGSTLKLGKHTLSFVAAPQVHWPEVMFSYDETDKVLFSADAFGKFGALDVEDDWVTNARSYYFGIVGKFGKNVQMALSKVAGCYVKAICPLHGPVLTGDLSRYLRLYDTWSSYRPEESGVTLAYTSVYGHTKEAVRELEEKLRKGGATVAAYDLARDDMVQALASAFRYDRLVLATTTYANSYFPFMHTFVTDLVEHNYQNRTVGMVENGSWMPVAAKQMREALEGLPSIRFARNVVTLKGALNDDSRGQLDALAKELLA